MFYESQNFGSYNLIKKLGSGGFGEVWLAKKRSLFISKEVAIKVSNNTEIDLDSIAHEAKLWEKASGHPNIVPILDVDEINGLVLIISEYIDGGSLQDKLNTVNYFTIKQSVEITKGILRGLEYLHKKGIIHRDLKPQNILLQGETPRITDFGISRFISSTTTQNMAGTPAYMAPEAFDGVRSVQTDIWAVGTILYKMLIGNLPFPQRDTASLIKAILYNEISVSPLKIPTTLQFLISKSLSKSPENRFTSAQEMLESLESKMMNFELMMETVPNNHLGSYRKVLGERNKKPRQQHYYFAHRYLPKVISRNPKVFIEEILEPNSKRLNFEWVHCAAFSKPDDEEFIEANGLTSEPIYFSDELVGALIKFPQPERIVEAYFAGIIVNEIENTSDREFRYITLEVGNNGNGIPRTLLGEWRKIGENDFSHFNYGTGSEPISEHFIKLIQERFDL